MQRDEHEKDGDARGEHERGGCGARRQGEHPRGTEDNDEERGEPASAEQLAAPVRSRRRRVEIGGALLVPTCDVGLVRRDQDLSSFSD
jgi:hypothetical protein